METITALPAASTIEVKLEIPIAAPREKVWRALTADPDKWWHANHRFSPGGTMEFNAAPGGMLIERSPDGGGLLWYTVLYVKAPEMLLMTGDMMPPFCGTARSYLALTLESEGETTVLRVHDTITGFLTEEFGEGTVQGWTEILGTSLREYAEQQHSSE